MPKALVYRLEIGNLEAAIERAHTDLNLYGKATVRVPVKLKDEDGTLIDVWYPKFELTEE